MTDRATAGGQLSSAWLRFAILASIEFLTVMDASVTNIALPTIRDDLLMTDTETAWVVSTYLVFFAGFLLLFGRLSDRLGRRRQFMAGTATFTMASAICALSSGQAPLLIGRGLQGIGAAMVVPAALALIIDLFAEGPDRHRALGIFSGMAGVAAPVGLVLGGLLASVDWHLVFWINVPLGVMVVAATGRVFPSSPRAPSSIDVLGAVAITGALMLLISALTQAGSSRWASPNVLALLIAAATLGGLFVRRQLTATNPLIPPGLLEHQTVRVGAVVFTIVGTGLMSTFFSVTMFLQRVRGLGPLESAVAYLPLPLAMLLGTLVAPRLLAGLGPRLVLTRGLALQAAALGAWALSSSPNGSLAVGFALPTAFWAFGLGLSIVTSFVVCTTAIEVPLVGSASGVATASYQGGGAVGLSLMVLLMQTIAHRALVSGAAPPDAALSAHRITLWALAGLACLGAVLARAKVPTALDPASGAAASGTGGARPRPRGPAE